MKKDGKLYPLFIDKNTAIPIGEWIKAEYHPTKGFAPRGGWHIGTIPDAPWLKCYDGSTTGSYKSRFANGKRVWCLVEYNATNDITEEVKKLPKKSITDDCPKNGYYIFREAGKGNWIISSSMKIIRIITENERQQILNEIGYNEIAAYAKYKTSFEKRNKTLKNRFDLDQ